MALIEMSYFGSVKEGKLKIRDRASFDNYVKQFEGKDIEILVKRKSSKRNLLQNAFFHAWIKLLSEHTGYGFEEMKEIIKFKFLQTETVNEKTGEIMKYIKPTSSLNKSEFADLCNDVYHWCYDMFGIRLPLPDENWELKFN